jgi:hypothetical protein
MPTRRGMHGETPPPKSLKQGRLLIRFGCIACCMTTSTGATESLFHSLCSSEGGEEVVCLSVSAAETVCETGHVLEQNPYLWLAPLVFSRKGFVAFL